MNLRRNELIGIGRFIMSVSADYSWVLRDSVMELTSSYICRCDCAIIAFFAKTNLKVFGTQRSGIVMRQSTASVNPILN